MNFKEYTIDKITSITGLEREMIANAVETPPEQKLGDLAFPCFILARTLKKAPPIIAQELAEKFFKQQNWIRVANEIKRVVGDGDLISNSTAGMSSDGPTGRGGLYSGNVLQMLGVCQIHLLSGHSVLAVAQGDDDANNDHNCNYGTDHRVFVVLPCYKFLQ